jgi:hypothetical protein
MWWLEEMPVHLAGFQKGNFTFDSICQISSIESPKNLALQHTTAKPRQNYKIDN